MNVYIVDTASPEDPYDGRTVVDTVHSNLKDATERYLKLKEIFRVYMREYEVDGRGYRRIDDPEGELKNVKNG